MLQQSDHHDTQHHPLTQSEEQKRRMDTIWQGRAARLFCLCAGIILGVLLIRYALPCLTPFLFAWLLSFPIRRGALTMQKKLHIPRRVGACILLLAVLLPLGSLTVLLGERLILEAQHLLASLGSGEDLVVALEETIDFFTRITSHIPPLTALVEQQSLESFWQQVDATVATLISETLTRWSAKIPDALTSLVRAFPSALIFFLTFLVTVFYCCTDDGRISQFLHDIIPALWRPRWERLRRQLVGVGARYLRAYFLLFLLTFVQLFAGFSILRLPYIFLPALLIALVDILPILGAGMVLLPWGILSLLQGETAVGTGLLILFAVILLTRQILEPRIIGGSLGLHPLASLLAVYAGLRLGGVLGMILAPAVALLIKSIWEKEPLGR
ncbi:MAG: sporulation integral membrane protein YtvI [Clostridia bacterium]|nr:sporulation integral membrane protein YtvI [Clostridia bacterium]MBQ7339149.1 sporulation integral membrane protein YtvI [Clostridia bacterium]